jgi:hypothetical protein
VAWLLGLQLDPPAPFVPAALDEHDEPDDEPDEAPELTVVAP